MALDFVRPNSTRHYRFSGPSLSRDAATIAFWCRLDKTSTGYQYLLSNGNYSTADTINFYTDDAAATWKLNIGLSVFIPTGTFANAGEYLVVATFASSVCKFYAVPPSGTATELLSTSCGTLANTSWYYGSRADLNVDRFTHGDLGPLMFFNRALTVSEIQNLAAGAQPSTVSGLVNHWRFTSPTATVTDEVGGVVATQYGTGWATAAVFPGETTGSGTVHDLAGSAAGVSSAAAALLLKKPLAASASAVATATATLSTEAANAVPLSGAASAISSGTAVIVRTTGLAVVANAVSTAVGALGAKKCLRGVSAATAGASGQLSTTVTGRVVLEGSSRTIAQSYATADLTRIPKLTPVRAPRHIRDGDVRIKMRS